MSYYRHIESFYLFRHFIETTITGFFCCIMSLRRNFRCRSQRNISLAAESHQQHFGSLDDKLLNDLGLLRGDMLAAEYGIIPGDQALHQASNIRTGSNGRARSYSRT